MVGAKNGTQRVDAIGGLDRAEAIAKAIELALGAEQDAIKDAAQALVYLRDTDPASWRESMASALRRVWLVEELKAFGLQTFKTDSEASAAWESVGKDEAKRNAWVRERLERFAREIAPPPDLARLAKALPATVPARPRGSFNPYLTKIAAEIRLVVLPFRLVVLPFRRAELIQPGGSARLDVCAQGIFRPSRLLLSVPGDATVPCEKCGHENEGPSLRDLSVVSALVGCMSVFDGIGPMNADIFSARRDHVALTWPTAQPGITISVAIENRGRKPVEVSGALMGEYMPTSSGLLDP